LRDNAKRELIDGVYSQVFSRTEAREKFKRPEPKVNNANADSKEIEIPPVNGDGGHGIHDSSFSEKPSNLPSAKFHKNDIVHPSG